MNSLILLQSLPSAVNQAVDEVSISRIDMLLDKLLALSLTAGKRILVAVLIYIAGRFVIKIIYGAQNEAYMSRSAEKWVRGLCFNELGVGG